MLVHRLHPMGWNDGDHFVITISKELPFKGFQTIFTNCVVIPDHMIQYILPFPVGGMSDGRYPIATCLLTAISLHRGTCCVQTCPCSIQTPAVCVPACDSNCRHTVMKYCHTDN